MSKTKMKWYEVIDVLCKKKALPSRILLWGLPGVGKSYWATTINKNFRRVTLTRGTQPEELTGMYTLQSHMGATETKWQDGPAITMMREGGVLIIEEVDHMGAELEGIFYALGDDPNIACVTLPTGEVVRPAKGFTLIATSNLPPSELAEPIADRFSGGLILHCLDPHPEAIKKLPENLRTVATNHYTHIGSSAQQWRAALSYRSLTAFAHLSESLGRELAASLLWGDDIAADVLASIVVASSK